MRRLHLERVLHEHPGYSASMRILAQAALTHATRGVPFTPAAWNEDALHLRGRPVCHQCLRELGARPATCCGKRYMTFSAA